MKYLKSNEVCKRSGWSERTFERKCKVGELQGSRKNKRGQWEIPENAHPKFSPVKTPDDYGEQLNTVSVTKKDKALKRLGIIKDFERFVAAYIRDGGNMSAAKKLFAARQNIGLRTLERWLNSFRQQGVVSLVDNRGIKFTSDCISPDAFELFKSMYLTQQKLSVKLCWQNINYINSSQAKGWNIPSLPFMYKYIEQYIPLPVKVLHRDGLDAYEARCAPYIQLDPDSIQPNQVWVGDHSQFNCWIRDKCRWVRPWITVWQDMRSRAILGRHIAVLPNQTTILLAFKRAIEKYGLPESVKIDNGRDYDSEMWTGTTKKRRTILRAGYLDTELVAGIYAMMNVTVSFAIPYHAQSKPVERWFDTVDVQFTKTIETYCGKDTESRPDDIKDKLKDENVIRRAYDITSFIELVDQYINVYNHAAHSKLEGQSPLNVFSGRQSQRILSDGIADLLLRVWSGKLSVGKNGVKVKGIWYGQYDTELMLYQGKSVRVAYDPDDMRQIYIYDANTLKLLTIAEQNRLVSYGQAVGEQQLREAMAAKSRARKIAKQFTNSRLTANMDITDLTLRAMDAAAVEAEPEQQKTIRFVKTPLDGQAAEHKRREVIKAVRKASGGEGTRAVLDMDLSLLNPKYENRKVKLFDE